MGLNSHRNDMPFGVFRIKSSSRRNVRIRHTDLVQSMSISAADLQQLNDQVEFGERPFENNFSLS